jgi:hypothetical protein
MKEKFKLIESKKELYSEISVATGRSVGTVRNHWFDRWEIPERFESLIESIIDKRIDYQEAVKKLHIKYFGK